MMQFGGSDPWKGTKSYVFSNTWTTKPDNAFELVSKDVVHRVKQIKQAEGKDIWLFGGASLTASLMEAGLVDEIWLSVHPILLGAGKLLFSGTGKRVQLKLIETKSYETGLVSLRYIVV